MGDLNVRGHGDQIPADTWTQGARPGSAHGRQFTIGAAHQRVADAASRAHKETPVASPKSLRARALTVRSNPKGAAQKVASRILGLGMAASVKMSDSVHSSPIGSRKGSSAPAPTEPQRSWEELLQEASDNRERAGGRLAHIEKENAFSEFLELIGKDPSKLTANQLDLGFNILSDFPKDLKIDPTITHLFGNQLVETSAKFFLSQTDGKDALQGFHEIIYDTPNAGWPIVTKMVEIATPEQRAGILSDMHEQGRQTMPPSRFNQWLINAGFKL